MRFRRATASGGCSATAAASSQRRLLGARRRGRPCGRGPSGAPRRRSTSFAGQQQVLGDREAAEGDQPGRARPGRRARAPGKRSRRFEPPTRRSQATAISAPPPTHVAVAGGDRRLREAGQLVVEVGRTAPSGAPGPRRRAPRGRRRRPRGPCGRSRRRPGPAPRSSSRAAARWPSISSSICGVDRVAGLGPVEPQQRDARLVDVVGGHASLADSSPPRRRSARPGARSRRRRGRSARATSSSGSAKRAEHVGGDDLGVGRVGPPDPDPHPPEVGAAEALREALQPVVAGEPAAELGADLAERQVDLVVERRRRCSSGTLQRAARRARPRSPDSFM